MDPRGVLKIKTKVVFNIDNFDFQKRFVSRHLTIGTDVWKIDVEPNQFDNDLKERWMTVGLKLMSSSRSVVTANFVASIIDSEDNRKYGIKGESPNDYHIGDEYTLSLVKTLDVIPQRQQLFAGNKLRVCLYIIVYSQDLNVSQIGLDYRKSFNVKELSDFEIICGEKKFFVSKLILNSRSKAFEKLFLSDKRKVDVLVIDDIEQQVLEEFLKYLYFGHSDHLDQMKEQLLRVSIKYQVLDLTTVCENLIFTEIDAKNATKLLLLFDELNCLEMKDKTIEFIANNFLDIRFKMNDKWKPFIQSNVKLFDKICKRMASMLKNGIRVKADDSIKTFTFHYIK